MKKTILTFLVVCFAAFYTSAQVASSKANPGSQKNAVEQSKTGKANTTNQTNPQVDNPNAPVITFDKMVHDYGTIAQNADGSCEFKFTNDGKEPLILSNVRAS